MNGTLQIATPNDVEPRILCHYDPVLGGGSDLVLRCRCDPADSREDLARALRIRWWCDAGRILVWEASTRILDSPDGYGWISLSVTVPVPPRSSAFLRFDLFFAIGGTRITAATGFVQPGPIPGSFRSCAMTLSAPSERETRLRLLPAAVRGAITATAVVTLPAWRLAPDGSGLLIVRVDPPLRPSLLSVENWPGFGKQQVVAPFGSEDADGPALLVLPEAGLKASEARLVVVRNDGTASAARIRVSDASAAAGGHHRRREKGVAAVLTSCGRQDLLEKTLDSFFACNAYPIAQTIIVEDGPQEANSGLMQKYRDDTITWLSTDQRVGQIAAIDYAYSFVEQPYIFHLEDDWQFYRGEFVEKSLTILEALPDCLQVWIRALHDTNRTPISTEPETIQGVAFQRVRSGYLGKWHGFSFNPGLRRTRDYDRLGKFAWHVQYDPGDPDTSEWQISALYQKLNLFAVILSDNGGKGYVRHLGFGRRVIDRTTLGW